MRDMPSRSVLARHKPDKRGVIVQGVFLWAASASNESGFMHRLLSRQVRERIRKCQVFGLPIGSRVRPQWQ